MPTSGSNALFTTNAIFIALAIAVVIVRFHERRRLAAALLADDYLILLALVPCPPYPTETLLNPYH